MAKKTTKTVSEVEINGIKGFPRGDLVSAMVPVSRLYPVEWNANCMNEKEYAVLLETIERDGFLDSLAVIPREDGNFDINGGHHRWEIACSLGMAEVPCDILWDKKWQDISLQQLQSVRFNVIKGNMNPEKFLSLHNKVVDKFGQDKIANLMGYTHQNGVDKIIKSVAKQMKETLPKEMAERFEDQAKDAKTVGDLDRIIKHIFNEHGDSAKYNFMIFSFNGKEHTYIIQNENTHKALKAILEHARAKSLDVNELIGEALESVVAKLNCTEASTDEQVKF